MASSSDFAAGEPRPASLGCGEHFALFNRAQMILERAKAVALATEEKVSSALRKPRSLDAHWAALAENGSGQFTLQPYQPQRILVVEDHQEAAASMAMLLESFGHEVAVAKDGSCALEVARVMRPHTVILDVCLPGMDGCEVARRLAALCMPKRPRLIAVSGYGGQDQAEGCAAAGIERLLLKPVDPNELRIMLQRPNQKP
jgi:CheY-like chemotaxis protein